MRIGSGRSSAVLGLVALACGGVAAWMVQREIDQSAGKYGPPARVIVASGAIAAGTRIRPQSIGSMSRTIAVPGEFVPPDAVTDASEIADQRAMTDIPPGGYLTRSVFSGDRISNGFRLRDGERAVSVDALTAPDGSEPTPGSIVDLFASGIGGAAETRIVIAGAEVLAVAESIAPSGGQSEDGEAAAGPQSRITLRISVGQVPAVVRADVFAREVRAVVR